MSTRDLVTGVVAGFVAAILWAIFTWAYRRWQLWRNFAHLGGTYSSTRKQSTQAEPETITITVHRNVLHVGYENLAAGGSASGEIAMNEGLPRSGQGHYTHITQGVTLWGFYDVQVIGRDEILVHSTFVNAVDGREVVSPYVWRRI